MTGVIKLPIYFVFAFLLLQNILGIWLVFEGVINGFNFITSQLHNKTDAIDSTTILMLFTCTGALLGSNILNVISFHRYIAIEKKFDPDHVWGFFLNPFLSITIGAVAFGLLQAGLFILNGSNIVKSTSHVQSFGYLGFGAIAGYNWDVFVQKIQNASKSININK
ncbi:hypothetical protein SIO17_14550 [Pseudoalteromonas piscicida]|uniref:hypothetical protein n=1 Tax=Pseudoalteromonas piscicida TaxID=43662 RepID=UPI00026D0D3A|nr:hypothetical protein [Pseudoalteromonas piscicida]WPU30327.1 hypothetical protein SIO17_14550 [Pseudoalteromonas piscicida]